ncbi:MAG: hypothetical protein JWP85_324 [Rhodoglobus sp.]|nr:hypothetical protein [Rhodoglobus sp.]
MRALQLEAFGHLVVVDMADPVAGPGEIVMQTIATGICGSDIHGYTGDNGRRSPGQVMGHETVGRIHEIGPGVDAVAYPIGSLATVNPVIVPRRDLEEFAGREQHAPARSVVGVNPAIVSAFAERFVVPAGNVLLLPESMPETHGALIEPLAVGLNAVRRVSLAKGDRVLIIGGGPIGQSTVLAALYEGASEVYVSELNEARRQLCASLGAIVIDPREAPVAEQLVLKHGGLVDVAVDAVGISQSLSDALLSTAFGGRVCLVGMGSPQLDVSAYRISTEERSVIGSFTYSFDVFRDCAEWVARGDAAFDSLISAEVGLDEADSMFHRLATVADIPGKAIVRLDR